MDFMLRYRGPLASNGSVKEKHAIRNAIHVQLPDEARCRSDQSDRGHGDLDAMTADLAFEIQRLVTSAIEFGHEGAELVANSRDIGFENLLRVFGATVVMCGRDVF